LLFFQRVPLLSIMIADEVPDYGDADQYINDPAVEQFWAIKAYMQANVHMNLIMSVTPSGLRLNTRQDDIYASFRKHFPTLNVEKVTEVELKGDTKSVWRELCEEFKDLEDYNMGTLLRQDSTKCYSQDNTIIVPKMIYLAIEIARNIEGVNDRSKEAYTTDHKQEEAREVS
ncbi:hypothetical protein PENTCL1PPCAC_22374, partial [Pristionchus entomophagus]